MTLGEALARLVEWDVAMTRQAARVLGPDRDAPDWRIARQADVMLFAVALRNVIRAVDLVATMEPALAATIEEAKRRFDQDVPDSPAIRNVLEHFDAYALGTGRMQPESVTPAPAVLSYEDDRTTVRLTIIDARARRLGPLRLDVADAARRASELLQEVGDAAAG